MTELTAAIVRILDTADHVIGVGFVVTDDGLVASGVHLTYSLSVSAE